jgi:CarD family transcriptional regulator
MKFAEGQTLVHPYHGPATVRMIRPRLRRNTYSTYVMLEIHNTDLTVGVPVENAEEVGLRKVLDAGQMEALFDVLRGPSQPEDPQWARRFKDNQERLRSGDIFVIAGLVRDLARRWHTKGTISHAEEGMLQYARKPLVTEMALSKAIGLEAAAEVLDSLLGGCLYGFRQAADGRFFGAGSS